MLSRPGYVGRFGRVNKPWYLNPDLEALAEDDTYVKPAYIVDVPNSRFASVNSNGELFDRTRTEILENFSRASIAPYYDDTGTLQFAAVDTLRETYKPNTLVNLGFATEETKVSLLFRSNSLSGGLWQKGGISSVSAEYTHKGHILANLYTNTANSVHEVYAGAGGNRFSLTLNTDTAIGFVIKRGSYQYVTVGCGNGAVSRTEIGCTFDFNTNSIVASGVAAVGTIEGSLTRAYIDEIIDADTYRIVIVGKFTNGSFGIPFTHIRQTGTYSLAPSFTTLLTDYFTVGDITAELGSYATSLLRADGSYVVRAADSLYTDIIDWRNPVEGTFIVHSLVGIGVSLGLGNSTGANRGQILESTTENGFFGADSTAANRTVRSTGSYEYKQSKKTAVTYAPNYIAAYSAGAFLANNGGLSWANWLFSRLSVGRRFSSSDLYNNQPVSYIVYYPKRLKASELIRLTT